MQEKVLWLPPPTQPIMMEMKDPKP
jgi:hypothetical protein